MSGKVKVALSPAAKAATTRAAFLRKVELLETWAATGFVDGDWFPKTLAEFAAWEDQRLGVRAWRKANIVSDSRYMELRKRYDMAIARLLKRAGNPGKGDEERRRRNVAERNVVGMAEQLVAERFAHEVTRKKLRLAIAAGPLVSTASGGPNLRVVKA